MRSIPPFAKIAALSAAIVTRLYVWEIVGNLGLRGFTFEGLSEAEGLLAL